MRTHEGKKALVIGAGIAGLATAIRLAAQGFQTSVYETAEEVGGKIKEEHIAGYRFDLGPSLFTMPELILELDALARASTHVKSPLPAPFQYQTLDRSTHYFWEDGTQITAWANREAFKQAAMEAVDVHPRALDRHLVHSQTIFESTRALFLEQSLHEWGRFRWSALRKALPHLHQLPWIGSLHRLNRRTLREPHLVQLFDRYATYNGSDPHRAPAMLHAIPHLEHGLGTYFPEGGMAAIVKHLHALGISLGVVFHFGQAVQRIVHQNGQVQGITLEKDGQSHRIPADVVVSNADIHPTYRKLLPELKAPENILKQERSTSGVIFYWGVRKEHAALHLHNIFFSQDYRREFQTIEAMGHPGADPTVYINISSKVQPSDAPDGCENWFVMVNVSADPDAIDAQIPTIRQAVLDKITRTLGHSIEQLIDTESVQTPRDIEQRTSSWRGALYGASSNKALAAFLRHRNRSRQIKGLYFCGGSVHPGGGIPLCLLSARIASELIRTTAS
jgi:diapolycopene oxygenase